MTEETVSQPVSQPKRRGRPKKLPGVSPEPKKTERPLCEKSELAKYPPDGIIVEWGVAPECKQFKRKGLAILFNPGHPGGQVTLMPVTDDAGGELRWRYRFIPGPMPFHYDKIDLEPGQAAAMPAKLRTLADKIESAITNWFGGQREADQTSQDFLEKKRDDGLAEKIKKYGVF
jgi:hypothetical protein